MSILIGLNGRRGAGKDTAFSFIQEWANERGVSAHRRGFADALKQSFARLFIPDISVEEAVMWCDELKTEESGSLVSLTWGRLDDHYTKTSITHQITGRQALQRHGTESHRDVFGEDFWVDALLPIDRISGEEDGWAMNFRGPLSAEPPEICVITDCRFENEAERIRALGGKIWTVARSKLTLDPHISETPLPDRLIDLCLENVENDRAVLASQVFAAMDDLHTDR